MSGQLHSLTNQQPMTELQKVIQTNPNFLKYQTFKWSAALHVRGDVLPGQCSSWKFLSSGWWGWWWWWEPGQMSGNRTDTESGSTSTSAAGECAITMVTVQKKSLKNHI